MKDGLDVMRLIAYVYLTQGHADRALALLRALWLLDPGERRTARLLARAAVRCHQPRLALQLVEQMMDAGDAAPVMHLLHGQALAGCGRADEALVALEIFGRTRQTDAQENIDD